jgi:3',5'-cyclic AMP phosphodiesterase CpdA
MVFVDSCAGVLRPDETGLPVDPPGDERLHCEGLLGGAEASWIRRVVTATSAAHVFVWLHHPPATGIPLFRNDAYRDEWTSLLSGLPTIRGFGCGHTHVPTRHELEGRPIFVAPSLKSNFDLEAGTWLPPGYRTYELHGDGTIHSDVHLIDDERWPRRPFGRAVRSLFAGELTHAELAAIVARKSAGRGPG